MAATQDFYQCMILWPLQVSYKSSWVTLTDIWRVIEFHVIELINFG